MTKPVYELILDCNTIKELGIVLDFQTKQIIIDEIMLPMRNNSSLASTKIEKKPSCEQQHGARTYEHQECHTKGSRNLGCQL